MAPGERPSHSAVVPKHRNVRPRACYTAWPDSKLPVRSGLGSKQEHSHVDHRRIGTPWSSGRIPASVSLRHVSRFFQLASSPNYLATGDNHLFSTVGGSVSHSTIRCSDRQRLGLTPALAGANVLTSTEGNRAVFIIAISCLLIFIYTRFIVRIVRETA